MTVFVYVILELVLEQNRFIMTLYVLQKRIVAIAYSTIRYPQIYKYHARGLGLSFSFSPLPLSLSLTFFRSQTVKHATYHLSRKGHS